MTIRIRAFAVGLAAVSTLSAVGCSGGGASAAPEPAQQTLALTGASLRLPGGQWSVSASAGIRAGSPASLIIHTTAPAGQVRQVDIGYATDHRLPAALIPAMAAGPGRYEAQVPIPGTVSTGARLAVRVIDANGNHLESGIHDLRMR